MRSPWTWLRHNPEWTLVAVLAGYVGYALTIGGAADGDTFQRTRLLAIVGVVLLIAVRMRRSRLADARVLELTRKNEQVLAMLQATGPKLDPPRTENDIAETVQRWTQGGATAVYIYDPADHLAEALLPALSGFTGRIRLLRSNATSADALATLARAAGGTGDLAAGTTRSSDQNPPAFAVACTGDDANTDPVLPALIDLTLERPGAADQSKAGPGAVRWTLRVPDKEKARQLIHLWGNIAAKTQFASVRPPKAGISTAAPPLPTRGAH